MTARLLIVALLLNPCGAAARVRAVGSVLDGSRILVVVAHPDDEILFAPLLGRRCVAGRAACTLVVMTRGEAGQCLLPEGCGDLGALRADEMRRSSALLNAQLLQWSFPDVLTDVARAWESYGGSRKAVVEQLSAVIAQTAPDLILTFDPAHGSTCHPAHREIARLVLESTSAGVFHLSTVAHFTSEGFVLENGAPGVASVFVANTDWNYAVNAAATHRSQLTDEEVESLRRLSDDQRRVWLIRAGSASLFRCE